MGLRFMESGTLNIAAWVLLLAFFGAQPAQAEPAADLSFVASNTEQVFYAGHYECGPRYMLVVKTIPENTPQRKMFEEKFFHVMDMFTEEFQETSHEELVQLMNNDVKRLYSELQSGQLAEQEFWSQVNKCDDFYSYERSWKKPTQ